MGSIYGGKLAQAKTDLATIKDATLKSYYMDVISIFESGRNFTTMTEADIDRLEKYTNGDDAASSAARHILEYFAGKHYPVKPFVHNNAQFEQTSAVSSTNAPEILFQVYPNPSTSSFTTRFKTTENAKSVVLKWYDGLGRMVKSSLLSGNAGELTIQNKELGKAGIYKCILYVNDMPVSTTTLVLQ